MTMQHPVRTELWAILRLAGPLIASQLAHMLMVLTDTLMMARQGKLLIAKCLVSRQDDSGAAHPTWAQQSLDAFCFQVSRDFFLLELHCTQG